MDLIRNFPFISIILSLICAVVTYMLDGERAKRLTICLNLTCAVMAAAVLQRNLALGEFTFTMGHFPAPWGNELRAGIIEPLFAAVLSMVLCLSILAIREKRYIEAGKLNLFFVMADLIQVSVLALVYTNDAFTGYVFIEICTIASSGLLMIRGWGRTTVAATRYMIFSLIGSGFYLIGITLLYDITGHLLIPNIAQAVKNLWYSGEYRLPLLMTIGLIVTGLGIKSGMFPFFFWMPDTYGYASPDAAAILSGVVSKVYILLMIKIIYSVIGPEVFYATGIRYLLIVFGVAGMIVGSLMAIREKQLDRMIAYSSAAQIGYVYMGIGMGGMGMTAAMLHIIAHAVTKPLLFLSMAKLSNMSNGSRKFTDIAGAGFRAPVSGVCFTVAAMSMVGIPGLIGFSSKLWFATAALGEARSIMLPVLTALAVSTLLNAAYYLRAVIVLYSPGGDSRPLPDTAKKERPLFIFALTCFTAMILYAGIFPGRLAETITKGLEIL